MKYLDMPMADEFARTVQYRQGHFEGEALETSVKIVLFNFGDRYAKAHCVRGDWSGLKKDMNTSPNGLPTCPRCGGVATQDQGLVFALVPPEEGIF